MNAPVRFDDSPQQALGFLVSQLSHIEPTVYQTKYPDITYADLVPVDTSANPWVQSIEFYSSNRVGTAKWGSGRGTDIPKVDLTRDKHTSAVEMATIGYDYSIGELNTARMLGQNLTADKGIAARYAYEKFVDDVAKIGDSTKGFSGLFNTSGVSAAAVAADGTGATTTWATKTPDLILRDVNAILTGIHTSTIGIEMADTLIMPIESFALLTSVRLTDTSMTLMEWIKRNNVFTAMTGQELTIRADYRLTTLGASTTRRMVAYRRSPDVVKMHVPMPLQFLAPQLSGLIYEVPGMFRIGGCEIRRPGSVRYADGL